MRPTNDVDNLTDAASSDRLQAGQIPRQPPLDVIGAKPLEITGPSAVSLTTQPEQVADIVVQRTGTDAAQFGS